MFWRRLSEHLGKVIISSVLLLDWMSNKVRSFRQKFFGFFRWSLNRDYQSELSIGNLNLRALKLKLSDLQLELSNEKIFNPFRCSSFGGFIIGVLIDHLRLCFMFFQFIEKIRQFWPFLKTQFLKIQFHILARFYDWTSSFLWVLKVSSWEPFFGLEGFNDVEWTLRNSKLKLNENQRLMVIRCDWLVDRQSVAVHF